MLISTVMGLAIALSPTTLSPGEASPAVDPGKNNAGDKGGKVVWKTDPEVAIREAQKLGAGMMLYFTSEG